MKTILKKIKKSTKVAVFGHQSPDGDCLGCLSAISFLCKALNKEVYAFIDDDIPTRYSFLDISFINSIEFDKDSYDLFISVDVADKHQLGKYETVFNENKNTISIDHHSIRDLVSDITYVDKTSSCSELLYKLITISRIKLNKSVSTFLYMGVSDDTGCFMHDNTTSNSHYVAGKLIENGADYELVNYNLFKLVTKRTYELTKKLDAIIQERESIRFVVVDQKFMQDNNCQKSDFGDYVNTLLNFEGTKISFTMIEKQQGIFSLSFRSLKKYDVAKVASNFGGGGHKQAAGGRIGGNMKKCLEKVLNCVEAEIRNGDNVNVNR